MNRPRRGSARAADAAGKPEAASPPRIIGGALRGRAVEFVPAGRTRPMKDRVRESLFNLIGDAVPGSLALDLFAGTGALAFEAVSRGAARAILAERHFPTAEALGRAARALGVAERVEVRPGDVLLWARRLPPLPRELPWLVFVSPPWSFFGERWEDLGPLVEVLLREAPPGSVVAVESDTSFDAALLPEPAAWRSRAVPPAVLHLWRRG